MPLLFWSRTSPRFSSFMLGGCPLAILPFSSRRLQSLLGSLIGALSAFDVLLSRFPVIKYAFSSSIAQFRTYKECFRASALLIALRPGDFLSLPAFCPHVPVILLVIIGCTA